MADGIGAPTISSHPGGFATFTASVRDGTEAFRPTIAISTNLVSWIEFTPGGSVEPFQLERTADFNDFRTYWYRMDDAPTEMFLRSSVRLPTFAP